MPSSNNSDSFKSPPNNKMHRWLHRQIDTWRREGLINSNQAEQLVARYPLQSLTGTWGKLVFTAAGAVLFGLGIILFFAYNWQVMPRGLKLGMVFLTLIAANTIGLTLWLNGKKLSSQALDVDQFKSSNSKVKIGESLLLLGTLLFGAGIFLVAQIYHIDEHYPNGMFVWSLGALLMAWAMYSSVQALLALFLLCMWQWFEVFDFNQANSWTHWLIAAATIPLAWLKRSQVLLFFSCSVFVLVYLISSIMIDDDLVVTGLFLVAITFITGSKIVSESSYPESEGIIKGIGTAVYICVLFSVCFIEFIDSLNIKTSDLVAIGFYIILPLLAAVVGFLLVFTRFKHAIESNFDRTEIILLAAALISLLAAAFTGNNADAVMVVIFHILFITHAVIYLLRGMQQTSWKQMSLGCAMLAAIIFARFLDLFESLLLRSLAFLILGGALFGLGLYFSKHSSKLKQSTEIGGHG